MTNSNNQDAQSIIFDAANKPIIFNAVSPQTNFVSRQLFAKIPRVFGCTFAQIR
jgi:hypothetical protein